MPNRNIEQAVQFAVDHETAWSRDTGAAWGIHHQDPPPWNRLLGPVHARGPVSGTIVVNGQTLTSWGEPERADLTFSVAKTYLALLAGVAHDRGLLPDVEEPVGARVRGIGFDAGRNAQVTWEHLLQQTSEWEGECFGVPDQVDRYRTRAVSRRRGGRQERRSAPARRRPAPTGNTTTCASTSSRSPCCTCSGARCPRCSATASCNRSVPATSGAGWGTTMRGSTWAGEGFSRFPAARIGAAACRSAASIRRVWANCSWTTAERTAVR